MKGFVFYFDVDHYKRDYVEKLTYYEALPLLKDRDNVFKLTLSEFEEEFNDDDCPFAVCWIRIFIINE